MLRREAKRTIPDSDEEDQSKIDMVISPEPKKRSERVEERKRKNAERYVSLVLTDYHNGPDPCPNP